jgi:hypothetical protein
MPDTGDALVLELEDLGRRLTAIDDDVDVVATPSTRSYGPNGARITGGAWRCLAVAAAIRCSSS